MTRMTMTGFLTGKSPIFGETPEKPGTPGKPPGTAGTATAPKELGQADIQGLLASANLDGEQIAALARSLGVSGMPSTIRPWSILLSWRAALWAKLMG